MQWSVSPPSHQISYITTYHSCNAVKWIIIINNNNKLSENIKSPGDFWSTYHNGHSRIPDKLNSLSLQSLTDRANLFNHFLSSCFSQTPSSLASASKSSVYHHLHCRRSSFTSINLQKENCSHEISYITGTDSKDPTWGHHDTRVLDILARFCWRMYTYRALVHWPVSSECRHPPKIRIPVS